MLGLFFFYLFSRHSAKPIAMLCSNLAYYYSDEIIADEILNISGKTFELILTDDFLSAKTGYNILTNFTYKEFSSHYYDIYCRSIGIKNKMKKKLPEEYIRTILPNINVTLPEEMIFSNFGPETNIINYNDLFHENTNYLISNNESCNTFISSNKWDSLILDTKWKKVCLDYKLEIGHITDKDKKIYGYLLYNIDYENDDDEYLNIVEISTTQLILSIVLILIPIIIIIISLYLIGLKRYNNQLNKKVEGTNAEPL